MQLIQNNFVFHSMSPRLKPVDGVMILILFFFFVAHTGRGGGSSVCGMIVVDVSGDHYGVKCQTVMFDIHLFAFGSKNTRHEGV